MGDLNVEVSTSLADLRFVALENDHLHYGPIKVSIGGTAANLALAAVKEFAAVNVLSRVGSDVFGQYVLDRLRVAGVNAVLSPSRAVSTGMAVYVRDATSDVAKGVRLLVVHRGANTFIKRRDIEQAGSLIEEADVFVLDGYCLLQEPRRAAARYAMRRAQRSGVLVAFDLVPHDAPRFFSAAEVAEFFEDVDIVIAEARTIRRVLGLPAPGEVRDVVMVHKTWHLLQRVFPGRSFHLRFGAGNVDQTLECRPGEPPILCSNGYVGATDPRGFGDRLTAAKLFEHLSRRSGT